jgi:plastocyanin
MRITRSRARLVVAGLCAVTLVACGSSGSTSSSGATSSSSAGATSASSPAGSSSPNAASTASTITIKGFAFSTPPSVSPGATVTVDNQDGTAHTVTADTGGAFDDQAAEGTSTFTAPTTPGSYPFHCSLHPSMHGTLVVK